jgi:hypothetical protein
MVGTQSLKLRKRVRSPPPGPLLGLGVEDRMARGDLKILSHKELALFVKRVEKLREQGLSMVSVSESLGVPVSTIYRRLKTFRSTVT